MSSLVFFNLFAIFVVVALGRVVGKLKWLGDNDPARTLSNAAFYIFIPALLFRTTARVDFKTLPWGTLVANSLKNTNDDMRRSIGDGCEPVPQRRHAWQDAPMNHGYGIEQPGEHTHTPHRRPAQYLVLIDTGGSTIARLFLDRG